MSLRLAPVAAEHRERLEALRQDQRDRSGVWKDGLLIDLLADELVRG